MIQLSFPEIGVCVYCRSTEGLSNEHVIPYGLGGDAQLLRASCERCREITGDLEQRLLRGHWWPYRKALRLKSRSKRQPTYSKVLLKGVSGNIAADIRFDQYPAVVVCDFDPPTILKGILVSGPPFARRISVKKIADLPEVLVNGQFRPVASYEKVEFPVDLDVCDVTRFLAKVAHCHAILVRGPDVCTEWFLPPYILGNGDGLLTYVGGAAAELVGPLLPGSGMHALMDRRQGEYLSVYVQMFRDVGEPPPIYEVVVGRLR